MTKPETHSLNWNGLTLEISFEPNGVLTRLTGEEYASLKVRSVKPANAPLPIARNGFYNNALPVSVIRSAGGAVNFVDVMLEAESQQAFAA